MNDQKRAAAAFIVIYSLLKKKNIRKHRRWWQTQIFRKQHNLLNILVSESGYDQFKNFTRMTKNDFEFLLNLITPKIMKKDTTFRRAISPRDRLALTLRFLATGDSYSSLQYLFKVSKASISHIVPEVCQAIVEVLRERGYIKVRVIFINIYFIFILKLKK